MLPAHGSPVLVAPTIQQGNPAADVAAYLSKLNSLRASKGLGNLTVSPELTSMAQAWTQNLVSTRTLAHDPDPVSGLGIPWTKFGENLGMGPNTDAVWNALVNSPNHYKNIADPEFTHVGVAVMYDGNGIQWTTHRFAKVGAPAPPPPVAAPPPVRLPPPPPPPPVTLPPSAPPPTTTTTTTTAPPTPPPPLLRPAPAVPQRVRTMLGALDALGA